MGLDMYLYAERPLQPGEFDKLQPLAERAAFYDNTQIPANAYEEGLYFSGYKWEGNADNDKAEAYKEIVAIAGAEGLVDPHTPSGELFTERVQLTAAYWRKANHIHRWFVDECQGGVDECQLSDPISREKLGALRTACQAVIDTPVPAAVGSEVLPTQSGFFFGGTEYDEWYVNDCRATLEQIDRALRLSPTWTFRYRSSW